MLEEIVRKAVAELRGRERTREDVLSRSRRARMLSKQSIFLIHNGALTDAKSKLSEAKQLLGEVAPVLKDHVELAGFEEVSAAQEEYAEACILHQLNTASSFPSPEDIGVSIQTYLLGLGDVVGELRRDALDSLRTGDMESAESDLTLMEHIYLSLLSMEEASLLLRGLRRKLDIARSVIESTRGELTTETARRRLGESIKELIERLDRIQGSA